MRGRVKGNEVAPLRPEATFLERGVGRVLKS